MQEEPAEGRKEGRRGGGGVIYVRVSADTHIQLTDALTSARSVAAAHTRLVNASPRAMRAMAGGSISPLRGCSPMAVAAPVMPKCV